MLRLYHTGFEEIKNPDVNYGRRNADFGGGFYLSDSLDFAERWATSRKDRDTYINTYELDLTNLKVKRFEKDTEWFDYISKNRAGFKDSLADFDVITGPIANDTLFDTYGIITSGLISREGALELLNAGASYRQINVKSEKAAAQLRWICSRIMSREELEASRKTLMAEQEKFSAEFMNVLSKLPEFEEINNIIS